MRTILPTLPGFFPLFVLIVGLVYSTPARALTLQPGVFVSASQQDTTQAHAASAAAKDSTAVVDTLGRIAMPSLVGTLGRSLDSSEVFTQDQIHWIDHKSLGDILATIPGAYLRSQNSAGQYDQLNIRGYDWRGIAVLENGRLLNDPASGIYNLFHFAPEYADRVEFITGPSAFLYGLNSAGGAINLLTKNYNSNRPFTKFNYTQSAYGYEYSDGTFSQNISRKLNVTFGFEHQSTDGRFPNSTYEAWTMRSKVRYALSTDLTLILSEYLTHAETNLNGGVDSADAFTLTAFDPRGATMRNLDSYEKVGRNDVDLSLVGTVLGDSANVSLISLYYSNNLREYRDEEDRTIRNGIFIHSDHRSSWMGVHLSQDLAFGFQRLSMGANIELRQIEGSPNIGRRRNTIGSVWGKDELLVYQGATVSGFARYDRYLGGNYAGVGADATLRLGSAAGLFAGISFSRRLPTYEELYWTDSTVSRVNPIVAVKHRYAEAGGQIGLDSTARLRIALFHRSVQNAIQLLPFGGRYIFPEVLYENDGEVVTNGIEATISARVWYLYVEGSGTYLAQKSGDASVLQYYPSLAATGGIYYWGKVPNTNLELKAGFRGKYQTSQLGMQFNPEILAYRAGTGRQIGRGGSVDFVLTGHIGDAFIDFVWENLSSIQFLSTPYYPILDRAIRFGVSWEFMN